MSAPRVLLAETAHRPHPLPDRPWVMAQRWHELLFAHWPMPAAALARHLPPGLALDLHEGEAWLGLVPFRMSAVRLRGLPALPGSGAFPELNVRTYVRAPGPDGERRGVWFFSLDASSRLAVRVARAWFGLPYFDAAMTSTRRGDEIEYRSRRTHRGAAPAEFVARYRAIAPVEPARPGSLEHFLTERYCLLAHGPRGLAVGEIHHRPWPLQRAEAELSTNTMAPASGLALPGRAPLLHFARELEVLVWAPVRVA